MKLPSLFIALLFLTVTRGQNVGIGVTTPGFPLSFPNTTGDKISLYGNSGNHYGFGIQGGLLQMYSDAAAAHIAFGYGQSGAFFERARIINQGADGMTLNGRLILKNGTGNAPDAGGVWLYKADNSALLGFMGTQNNQNIGFYGGPVGWGFTYDAINSRVGIGNTTPVNRLDIAGLNNWDLSNTEGDMRIGNSSYRLKFGIALGGGGAGATTIMQYGQTGGYNNLSLGSQGKSYININGSGDYIDFTNVNGGIRINGNGGSPGQVLQSNGNSAAPSWISTIKPYVLAWNLSQLTELNGAGVYCVDLPGLNNQTFTLQSQASIVITYTAGLRTVNLFQCDAYISLMIYDLNNQIVARGYAPGIVPQTGVRLTTTTTVLLPPGLYRMEVKYCRESPTTSGDSWVDDALNDGQGAQVIIQVFPS